MIAAISPVTGSFARLPLMVAALLAVAACGQAGGAVPDRQAVQFVSLNPCTDAILAQVAEPEQVLALSHYSADPQSSSIDPAIAARYKVTGGTVEEVAALNPDYVLAGTFLAPATRGALEGMGYDVVTYGIASDVAGSMAQIRDIARLAGHVERGEELIQRINAALARLDAMRAERGAQSALLWQPGQIVPGEHTLVAQLMARAGFTNHSATRGLGQADYIALETMLADPPDILLVAGSERGQRHVALANLAQTRTVQFDPSLLYCAGPTIIRAADRLAEIRASGA